MPRPKAVTTATINAAVEEAMRAEFERGKSLGIDMAEKIIGWTTRKPEPMTIEDLRNYLGQEIERLRRAQ